MTKTIAELRKEIADEKWKINGERHELYQSCNLGVPLASEVEQRIDELSDREDALRGEELFLDSMEKEEVITVKENTKKNRANIVFEE